MEYTTVNNTTESGILPFDPIVLVLDVLKRWLLVVMVAVAVGVNTYIITDMRYEPLYRTETTFVVTTRGSSASVYSTLASTTKLASVFTELLNSSILRKTIMQELEMSSFGGSITTSVIPDTNLITMHVTASDPWTAFVVAQSIVDHHETLTYRVIDGIILEVLQPPVMPTSTVNASDPLRQMIRMMVVAAVATASLFAVMSFLRDAVRSGKEAWKKLDCYYMGEIPHEKKHKTFGSWIRRRKTSILVTDLLTSFQFMETMRKLRRRVEQHMHGGKILMVTSLLENEGKSTVAVNLALMMGQKYQRVLLIDSDMRKPACHAILEQRQFDYGIQDVLKNEVSASEALIRYRDTNMYMLLGAKGTAKSGDLIASEEMKELLKWARERFDFIIVDLPPISVAADTECMKDLADASLLVVRQNMATAKALNKAVASLDGGKAKLMGCVLNNVFSTRLTSGQSYGYGRYNQYDHYSRKG
jgi:capsular exopolysaccharide synthesis family protein